MSDRLCLSLCDAARALRAPPPWAAARPRIAADSAALAALLAREAPPPIYGVNTLVGHMDDQGLDPEAAADFQAELLDNHALGGPPFFDAWTARCFSYAKAQAFSRGGAAVTPELYDQLLAAAVDPGFLPEVPRSCSYSCGDVIPGAHWARAFLAHRGEARPRPKEGLSLINGAFIHVGAGLAALPALERLWHIFLEASALNARACQANISNYSAILGPQEDPISELAAWMRDRAGVDGAYRRQDPISLRAFPQLAAALGRALAGFFAALDEALARPSDNPLIAASGPLSQASFLTPAITLATSQLVEGLLMVMWAIERRVHHLLSGAVPGIPVNNSSGPRDLGYVQVPKLMTAILEEARMLGGRRAFASGSSTSYGIEDHWSFGLASLATLDAVRGRCERLLAIELGLLALCGFAAQDGPAGRASAGAEGQRPAAVFAMTAERLAGMEPGVESRAALALVRPGSAP